MIAKKWLMQNRIIAHLAGAEKYTDCFSAEG